MRGVARFCAPRGCVPWLDCGYAMSILVLLSILAASPGPDLAALQKEAYERDWDVVAIGDLRGVSAGPAAFYGPNQGDLAATALQGVQLEVGNYYSFVGFSLFGIQVAQGAGTSDFLPAYAGASPVPLGIKRYGISAFQPRLRFHFWRLQAFAQAGLDFQVLVGQPTDNSSTMKLYSLGAGGRAGLRAFPFKGLFLEVGYGARADVPVGIGELPLQHGLLGGVGYAF